METDADQDLLLKKGGTGFPYLAALDADGNVLAKLPRVARTTANFQKMMEQARATKTELVKLTKKAKAGDQAAKIALFAKRLELSYLSAKEAKAAFADLKGLTDEQRKDFTAKLTSLEVGSILSAVQGKEDYAAAGAQLAAMAKAGRIPTARGEKINFWYLISVHAEEAKDAKLYGKAFQVLKAAEGIRPAFIEKMRTTLKRLKAK